MTNTNTSATGGYLVPAGPTTYPGGLTFDQFLQTVLVGISGLPGNLVFSKWQPNPPKQPDIYVNWLAFGIMEDEPDTFAYNSIEPDGSNTLQRMRALTIQCSYYGPNAYELCKELADGFQVGQNREALQSASMDFVSTGKMVRAPDVVNERWVNRWEMSVYLRAQILRVYPILTFASASGTLKVQNTGSTTNTIPISVTEG